MGCQFKQGGGLYTRLRVGAVLLAAGEGQRMGGVAKSLIRLQGVPLINRQLVALSGAGIDEVVVVTGHARDAVEAAVSGFPVTLAHNENYKDGQQGSVRAGLDKLGANCDAVLILLADQPLIGAADLTELIAAFKKRGQGHVLVPMVALWRSGLMPEVAGEVVVLIVLVASGLYFADRRMKTPDQWFRGFPALWNVELLYLFVFRPSAFLCAAITLILAACLFVPIVFVHPLRVRQLRRVTISVTTVWFAAAAVAVTEGFVTSILVKTILVACAIYMLALPLVRKSAPFACTPRNKT